ncbi:MAG TPA: hypothetical protein VFW65_10640 [Pseudonocardiaceae bacterium]|nr:hypothetical protein [Pseudonocardiaceae bacterium]
MAGRSGGCFLLPVGPCTWQPLLRSPGAIHDWFIKELAGDIEIRDRGRPDRQTFSRHFWG